MKSLLVIGTAILLAGGLMAVFDASQQETCSPAGTGCASVNYTLGYVGIVLILLGIVVVVKGYRQHPKVDST